MRLNSRKIWDKLNSPMLLQLADLAFLLGGAALIFFTLWHIGQDVNWDMLNYQLYNPYALLHHRLKTDIFPVGLLHTHLNPVTYILPYWLITRTSPLITFVVWAIIEIAVFGVIWLLVRQTTAVLLQLKVKVWLKFIQYLVTIACFFGAGSLGELGSASGDNWITIFVAGGLLCLVCAYNSLNKTHPASKPTWLLVLGGALLGAATGLKLTFAVYAIATLGAWWIANNRRRWRSSLQLLLGLVLGFMLTAGNWSMYLWNQYQNPFFPYFNGIFKSQFAPPTNWHDVRFQITDLRTGLIYPFIWLQNRYRVSELPFFDIRIPVTYIILVMVGLLAILGRWKLVLPTRKNQPLLHFHLKFWLVFWLLSLGISLWQFAIYRYLIPLEMLSPLVMTMVVGSLVGLLAHNPGYSRWRPVAWLTIVLVLLAMLFTTQRLICARIPWQAGKYFDLGIKLPDNFENSTLLVYTQPQGFMLPFLPANIQIIQINPELLYLQSAVLKTKIEMQLIKARQLFILKHIYHSTPHVDGYLAQWNLMLKPSTCRQFTGSYYQYYDNELIRSEICEVVWKNP